MSPKNVYELIQERLEVIFKEFDNIYISFSGGKDSGVLLNLCLDYMRRNRLKRRIGMFHMDYEIQYRMTMTMWTGYWRQTRTCWTCTVSACLSV